jgi:hypothetical protein
MKKRKGRPIKPRLKNENRLRAWVAFPYFLHLEQLRGTLCDSEFNKKENKR